MKAVGPLLKVDLFLILMFLIALNLPTHSIESFLLIDQTLKHVLRFHGLMPDYFQMETDLNVCYLHDLLYLRYNYLPWCEGCFLNQNQVVCLD